MVIERLGTRQSFLRTLFRRSRARRGAEQVEPDAKGGTARNVMGARTTRARRGTGTGLELGEVALSCDFFANLRIHDNSLSTRTVPEARLKIRAGISKTMFLLQRVAIHMTFFHRMNLPQAL